MDYQTLFTGVGVGMAALGAVCAAIKFTIDGSLAKFELSLMARLEAKFADKAETDRRLSALEDRPRS